VNSTAPISVLLVEDHNLLRLGIRCSVSHDQSISIIGEACNGQEAVSQAVALQPDIVLMDINMPIMSGLESSRALQRLQSQSKIIMLTSNDSQEFVKSALDAGASGYCLKDIEPDLLCAAIKAVHRGDFWLDSAITKKALSVSTDTVRTCSVSDKYEKLSQLGNGGMSEVWKAKHKLLDQTVAIKFLGTHLVEKSYASRFALEAKIMSKLSHPNLIGIRDYGIAASGAPFIVMDYEEGMTLAEVIEKEGAIKEPLARRIFIQVAEALEYAHMNGVIHRDAKPSNVLLPSSPSSSVKLFDFGLAKAFSLEPKDQTLTQSGLVFGSPIYMSPEQCNGVDVDGRTDIYALGCLMYETLSGRPPFRGGSAFETMLMHLSEEPKELPRHVCSPRMWSIIQRCLEKDKNRRFSSMTELLAHLR